MHSRRKQSLFQGTVINNELNLVRTYSKMIHECGGFGWSTKPCYPFAFGLQLPEQTNKGVAHQVNLGAKLAQGISFIKPEAPFKFGELGHTIILLLRPTAVLHVATDGAAMARHAIYAEKFQAVSEKEGNQGLY